MRYVVFYKEKLSIDAARKRSVTEPYATQQSASNPPILYIQTTMTTQFNSFDDEQEAIEFATKHDGVIFIPAQINSKIVVGENI